MYKKRELEYKAAYNKYQAEVDAGAAIGQGISQVGSGIGSALGNVMKGQQFSKGNELANVMGQRQFGSQWQGGGMQELDLMGKMKDITSKGEMTPYQSASLEQNMRRTDVLVDAEKRREQERKDRIASAANQKASKAYTEHQADTQAYLKDYDASITRLYDAKTPEAFGQHRDYLLSVNEAARKRGVDPSLIKPVPMEYVPESNRPSLELYKYQQQFSQGNTDPGRMRQLAQPIDLQQQNVQYGGPPPVSYGTGPGQVRPPAAPQKYGPGFNVPEGAIAAPGFPGKEGTTAKMNNKNYVFQGGFWVEQK
jgi:hypothetical protein